MSEAETPSVVLDIAEGIATIRLNRPHKLNALTRPMITEILDMLDQLEADDDVRAVIFTGAGSAYCAGADLASAGAGTFDYAARTGETYRDLEVERDWGGRLTLRLFSFLKPTIAAVHGAAAGIGATMLLPMDIRIAATGARFGFVFARRGIVPEAASSWFLPRLVGISTALEWCYSGRLVPAAEAEARGLVRSLHPPEELIPAARQLALELTQGSAPVSISLIRQMMWRMLTASHPMEAHRIDSRAMTLRGRSADAKEGVQAFLDKRAPVFPDRLSAGLPNIFPDWIEPSF